MRPAIVLRPSRSRWGAIAVSVLAVALLVVEGITGGAGQMLRSGAWLGVVSMACWLLWGLSSVRLFADRLVVDNPLTRTTLPWPQVTGARAEWGLVVEAAGREVRAWAVPSKAGHSMVSTSFDGHTTVMGGLSLENAPELGSRSPDSPAVHLSLGAGAAAELIRQELPLRSPRQDDAGASVQRTLHWGRLGVLVALAVLCAVTTL
ncbi:hypothetical protein GCM10027030_04580 [Luteococcus sediminum]